MAIQDAPFYPEIEALDEYFSQHYYAAQTDWLQQGRINLQAYQSLWDIVNNAYDNLDSEDISIDSLKAALDIAEEMNSLIAEVVNESKLTDNGLELKITREQYINAGRSLLDKLYQLELPVNETKQTLLDMASKY